jgi:amino acid adenylation domain-containing protein
MAYLLHQLLTRSAGRHPDREAVTFKNKGLTYRQLDDLSTRVARALARHGVGKGDRVGIYLNKSVEAVAAVYGALKAGAAYVPLDPSAPVKRVAFIVGNCAMKALITSRKKLAGLTPALAGASPLRCAVLTDEGGGAPDGAPGGTTLVPWEEALESPEAPPALLIEDDLAYILYTSGSTGEPKGVMISHRASLTFVDWAHECLQVREADRLSNHAPLHFDLSTFDLFVAAKAGAAVLPVPEELSVFPLQLADFIEQQQISVWYSVPSVLTRLVLHGNLQRHKFAHLRAVLFAGEVFPTKFLRQLLASVPHAQFYNLYGPTETNVCTYYHVKDLPAGSDEPISIGAACENTETFVVDERNAVAAPGEVGELYVRGPSLMKGYWGLPERARETLVPSPLPSAAPGELVYRTGDLVKEGPDGNYVFLGRRDSQIKSRGYRIELGEIESVLYRHPKVEEAAVIAVPDEQIGNVIRAVVVTRDRAVLARGELESFCAEHIPKYMVPGSFEFRPALPKTSTGKVDKPSLVREQLQNRAV